MKIRLTFDANPLVLTKSGVGYFTYELIQALASAYPEELTLQGYYFNFLGKKKPTTLPTAGNIQYHPVRFFPTKLINFLRQCGVQLPLELFLRRRSDVVLFSNFVSMPTLRKPLRVAVIYDLSFIDQPQFVSAKNGSFLRKWVPVSLRQTDMIITISEFTKKRIVEEYGIAKERVNVVAIPPGKKSVPDNSIIDSYKLRNGYVLFVGNIEPRKNILGLLKAYEQLPSELSKRYPLVLVGGKGWNDQDILAYLVQLQAKGVQVVQTGYVTDQEKAAMYQHATLCIQPSHYEGFGMPILEAMSYGKPVACSDLAVFREVAGDAAVFFDQNNPAAIAQTIQRLLTDSQQLNRLSSASRDRVASYKTWEDVAAGFYKMLQQELGRC